MLVNIKCVRPTGVNFQLADLSFVNADLIELADECISEFPQLAYLSPIRPHSIMMSPLMTTQLPLPSSPVQFLLPSSPSPSPSPLWKSQAANCQVNLWWEASERVRGQRVGMVGAAVTIRWLIIGQNVWNFSGTMILISPFSSLNSRPFSHL